MPTVMTHAVAALGLGKIFTRRKMPLLFWEATVILSALPDIDTLAFNFGIPYEAPFGHRGFTHSLVFALVVSLVVAALTCKRFAFHWWDLWGFFFVVVASHGLLDAFTNGGQGVAFFWPFQQSRFFVPDRLRVVEVSPIGTSFFSRQGLQTMWSEIFWIWLPAGLAAGLATAYRILSEKARKKSTRV